MKKILFTSIFALSLCSVKAQQDAAYGNIFFNNLYPNAVGSSTSEQTHYHISNTGGGAGGAPLLDVKWWGGINMQSEGGAVKLKSPFGTLYISPGGNIGINTENPTATLDVSGNARINSYGQYTFLSLGQQSNDQIIVDNTTAKHYGGGYFFRVHNDAATNQFIDALVIDENGNIGIGTNPPQNKLDVAGKSSFSDNMKVNAKIEAKEIKVTQSPTADFVFEENYNLPSLVDVEKHIREKKHLPEIASAREMEKEGVNIGEFQIKLLQKIEELTLYSIEQNKQIKLLHEKNESLQDQIFDIMGKKNTNTKN